MTTHDARESGFTLVEMLVAIAILGVVSAATFTVVLSAQRSQRFTEQVQDATNDARLSVERIRQQLRAARLVTPPSNARGMRFWVDTDLDETQDVGEMLCFYAADIAAEPDRYELRRWADTDASCATSFNPPADATVIARTLRNTDVFQYSTSTAGFSALPNPPTGISNNPAVRRVNVELDFDVQTNTGPSVFTVTSKVRLRNVP